MAVLATYSAFSHLFVHLQNGVFFEGDISINLIQESVASHCHYISITIWTFCWRKLFMLEVMKYCGMGIKGAISSIFYYKGETITPFPLKTNIKLEMFLDLDHILTVTRLLFWFLVIRKHYPGFDDGWPRIQDALHLSQCRHNKEIAGDHG